MTQHDIQGLTATQLGSSAIRASVERAGIDAGQVEEVYMGCVLQVLLCHISLFIVFKCFAVVFVCLVLLFPSIRR